MFDKINGNGLKSILSGDRYDIKISEEGGLSLIDDIYIFKQVLDDLGEGSGPGFISFKFHNTLAQVILEVCHKSRSKDTDKVVLSGGVFQNNYLLDLCYNLLVNNGFKVYTNMKVMLT